MITPEMARQELARRAQSSQGSQITPEMAKAELQRRAGAQANTPQQQSFLSRANDLRNAIGSDVGSAAYQAIHNPERAGKVAAASGLNLAQGASNFLAPQGSLLNQIQQMLPYQIQQQNVDYGKKLGVGPKQAGDTTLSALPYFAIPELADTEGLTAGATALTKGAEGAAINKVSGGDASTGFALGAALPGSVALARGAKYLPARMLRGTASPEELAQNLQAAGTSRVPIGKVTGSPLANRTYENTLALIPGSGVSGLQKSVADDLENQTNGLMSQLKNNSGSVADPNDELKEALKNAEYQGRSIKNGLYNNVSDIADNEGHQLDLSSFKQKSQDAMNLIQDSPLLQGDAKVRSFFNKVSGYNQGLQPETKTSSIIDSSGAPITQTVNKAPSITEANLVKNELWRQGQNMARSSSAVERNIGGKYKELSTAIGDDVKNSIKNTGSPELNDAFNSATEYYKQNYGKFLDKGIYKYLDESKPADSIARDIIKPSQLNDRHADIEKIQNLLPPEQKNLLGYAYLNGSRDAEGNVDPNKLNKLIKGVGPRQFNSLFTPETQNALANYSTFSKMSKDSLDFMRNPKTGYSNLKSWTALVGGTPLAAHALGLPGALAAAGGTMLGARGAAHLLTNPTVRNKLVQQMIDRAGGAPILKQGIAAKLISKHAPRLAAAQNNGGNQ